MISIIIPTLNEEKFLPKLLESLAKLKEKTFEVIVVDGTSSDKTVKKAKVAKATKTAVATVAPAPSEDKLKIIEQFATKQGDTGSPEVQIALLSKRIGRLADHLKSHGHDVHSRRGLLSMIAKRRRLINFLKKVDEKRVSEILQKIGLKD